MPTCCSAVLLQPSRMQCLSPAANLDTKRLCDWRQAILQETDGYSQHIQAAVNKASGISESGRRQNFELMGIAIQKNSHQKNLHRTTQIPQDLLEIDIIDGPKCRRAGLRNGVREDLICPASQDIPYHSMHLSEEQNICQAWLYAAIKSFADMQLT